DRGRRRVARGGHRRRQGGSNRGWKGRSPCDEGMNDDVLTAGLRRRLGQIEERYDELGRLMSEAGVAGNSEALRSFGTELASPQAVVDTVRALRAAEGKAKEAQELIDSDDGDLRDLAREALGQASAESETLVAQLRSLLVPRDPNDEKNVIVEIRGGEGGEEAALFAADPYRLYTRY